MLTESNTSARVSEANFKVRDNGLASTKGYENRIEVLTL
jgi:hypothetical protein